MQEVKAEGESSQLASTLYPSDIRFGLVEWLTTKLLNHDSFVIWHLESSHLFTTDSVSRTCVALPLEEVVGQRKVVPVDHPLITAARGIGSCFGD